MANTSKDSASSSPDSHADSGLDKSLVGKLMSGLINRTPLSKWFGGQEPKSGARRRDDDDDDPSYAMQPPNKRAKLPGSYNLYGSPIRSSSAPMAPSSFPEPMAGPSGLQSRRIRERTTPALAETNGVHDSDSEESSGYCSAPVLNTQVKPTESTEPEPIIRPRSLFTSVSDSRSLFSQKPSPKTSLSARRPNFDASIIGSPQFVDKTLSTKRILSSPFYSGRTTYGGASAYGRKFGSTNDLNHSVRSSIQIKPITRKATSETTALSKTARRILNTLEMYSTPVSDAKKIPVPERRQESLLSRYVGASPYLVRDRKRPSNRELQVPDLLQMKQKERLQNSTENMRQMATSSKSTLNLEEYRLRTDEDPKQKHINKIKSKSVLKTKPPPILQQPLPNIMLPLAPLTVNDLPSFGLLFGEPPKDIPLLPRGPRRLSHNHEFVFSQPLLISHNIPNLKGENSYKFSVPLPVTPGSKSFTTLNTPVQEFKAGTPHYATLPSAKEKTKSPISKKSPVLYTIPWECGNCLVRNQATDAKCKGCSAFSPSTVSPCTGSLKQFNPRASTWECSVCLIRNKNEVETCIACEAKRSSTPQAHKVSSNSFGDKFKAPVDTWECSACLIRNKTELDKCAACGTAKIAPAPAAPSFGDKFKAASDTWECPTCMIRNKTDVAKCVACETAKPGQKANLQFGILPEEWECKTCLIKNKYSMAKCAACEATREASIGFGDTFKMKGGEWSCDSCMVKNQSEVTVCVCCGVAKPGAKTIAVAEKKPYVSFNFGIDKAQSSQFQFGVPADKQEAKPVSTTFGSGAKTEAVQASTGFSFGAKPAVPTTSTLGASTKPEVVPASTGFSFGATSAVAGAKTETVPASTGFSFGAKPAVPALGSGEKTETVPANTGFSFGAKPAVPALGSEAKTETVPVSAGFSFGASPAPKAVSPATSTTFGAPANSDVKVPEPKLNPLLRPGEKLPEKALPAPPDFKFDKPKTDAPKPLFGVNGDLPKAKAFFGTPPKPAEPTINFNAPKPEFAAPTFKFDPKAMNTPSAASFSFGAKAPAEVPFKFEPPKPEASTPMFQFAAKPPEAAASPNLFKFGGKRPAETTNGFGTKMAAFGNGPSVETKPFGFGEAPKAIVPMSQEAKPSNDSGVFSFGAASPAPVATGGFNFAPSSGAGFNFGSNGSAATKNGSFNFGSNANGGNQKAIFSFGAGQTNTAGFNAAAPVQQPFKFAPTVTPVAAVPTPPTDGFNFTGAPPSFNFTDGGAGAQPQRKIRKALRRTQR